MKSAISRASSSITASTGLSDSAQIVRGGSNLTTVGAIPYVQSSGVLTQSAGLTFTDAANVRLATLAGGSSQGTNALLDVTNSAGSSHWLTVLGDGKVGVGTNAPVSLLHVTGTSPEMRLVGTGTGSGDLFTINLLNSIYSAQITHGGTAYSGLGGANSLNLYTIGAGALTLGTTSVERGRITAAGAWGIGTSNATPAAATTLSVLDATAASGATATWVGHDGSGTYSGVHLSALTTSLKVVAGTVQGSTNLQEWQNSAGSVIALISSAGIFTSGGPVNGAITVKDASNIQKWFVDGSSGSQGLASGSAVIWSSTTTAGGTADTSLSRIGAGGIIGGGTGAAGSVAGAFQATKYISAGTAFITWGTGTPEAAVTATVGSMFLRTDGGAATTLYVKESGSGNTGWVAK